VWFFQSNSTKRKLEEMRTELDSLKRTFLGMTQEWDAVQARVSKVLRRIVREEQAKDAKEAFVEDAANKLPLTLPTSSDRMARIREQLAARGKGGE